MKALFTPIVAILMMLQISCASGTGPGAMSKSPALSPASKQSALSTPEVAVMPMKEGILVAWKPINDADGYMVYRESGETKSLLGIGPREAQGFIDRNPPESTVTVKYSVQAFKLSAPSEKQETQALPDTVRRSNSDRDTHPMTSSRVAFPM
jgi:hypothetical protein